MPGLTGFDVALYVATVLGTSPPRTLLISGAANVHDGRLAVTPPSRVLGLMPKPFGLAEMRPVLSLIGESRWRCPGRCRDEFACPCLREALANGGPPAICDSPAYAATCVHYDTHCAPRVRKWLAAQSG
jgi:hypothetical protein